MRSRKLRERLSDFPVSDFKIETLPGNGLISSEILETAAVRKADLIILGSPEQEKNKTGAAVNDGYQSSIRRIASQAGCLVRRARRDDRDKLTAGADARQRISAVLDCPMADAKVNEDDFRQAACDRRAETREA